MTHTHELQSKRGFELAGYTNSIGFALVKAPIELVGPLLATALGGILFPDVYGKKLHVSRWLTTIHQYRGHAWTIFYFDADEENVLCSLSDILDTRCIYFQYDDVTDWGGYKLYEHGSVVEEYHWGPDMNEDVLTLPASTEFWDIDMLDDEAMRYQFCSQIRTVPRESVLSREFIHQFFLWQDAWLPNWEYLPYAETTYSAPAISTTQEFVRVDAVINP